MSEFDRLFQNLDDAARDFRAAAQDIDTILERFEARLTALRIEADVWLTDSPLDAHELSVSASNVATRIERQLGYAPDPRPSARGRCLCIRRAEVGERALSDRVEILRVIEIERLRGASAELRQAAIAKLPLLLERMTEQLRASTEVIRGLEGGGGSPAE